MSEAHLEAKHSFKSWVWHGEPSSGRVYDKMRESRKIIRARLKWCQKHEDQIKMDILAKHHSKRDFRSFWKSTNKLNSKPGLPVSVGGVSDSGSVAELFRDHFTVKSPLGPSRGVSVTLGGVGR